jgi:hypothetical protein
MAAVNTLLKFTTGALVLAGVGLVAGCDDDKSSSGGGSSLTCEPTGVPNKKTQPADVHPKLVGTYELVYTQFAKGAPFEDGDKVTAIIGDDNSLEIGGKKYCEPFVQEINGTPFDAEIAWYDTRTAVSYGLSRNDIGKLQEFNVNDYDNPLNPEGTIPGFLGQFKEAK